MNKYFKTIASAMVVFSFLVVAFGFTLSTAIANTGFEFDTNFNFDTSLNFDNTSNLLESGFNNSSNSTNYVYESNTTYTECSLKTSRDRVNTGDGVDLTWKTKGFTHLTINGEVVAGDNGTLAISNITEDKTYTLVATNDDGSKCQSVVKVGCDNPTPTYCELKLEKTVDKQNAVPGDVLTYTINIKNTGTANCTGGGVRIFDPVDTNITYLNSTVTSNLSLGYGGSSVYTAADRTLRYNGHELVPGETGTITWTGKVNDRAECGDFEVNNQAKATAKELNNFGTWSYSNTVKTNIDNDDCVVIKTPTCDMFKATPANIMVGASSTLAWETSNATKVFLNNGIGEVAVDGSIEVSPLADIVYKLTVMGTNDQTVSCEVPVKVSKNTVPVCESFTATPSSLPVGGGNVTLNWKVQGASSTAITPNVGAVALIGSKVVNVTSSTNFVLTAVDADGDQVTCPAPVAVADPVPLSCANNVSFTASATSIKRGEEVTLNWSTTNVDSVSISVIGSTALAGTKTVSPDVNTTYVLTAKAGTQSIDCPVSVAVTTSGGGGGGSSSPRCDLEISDPKISLGESITLKWNTSNASEVTITDSFGKVIVSTDGKLADEKKATLDGSITLKPTRNTEYTLLAERGSKDRTCKVAVKMDDVVVLQTRDQQPLVAGISLSQVPYTGFEAGPLMTIMFYTLLVAWAFYIAYLLVAKKKLNPTTGSLEEIGVLNPTSVSTMKTAEARRPDVFAASITNTKSQVPANLPVATTASVVGFENQVTDNVHQVSDVIVANLENHAHEQKALLSSDAVRHLVSTTTEANREQALDTVIAEAKQSYPLEDGWIVINESRMKNLCVECRLDTASTINPNFIPAVVPEGAGSLAEAIVTGNVVAAYAMIGNRPMFALADAAADLDALYRSRRGGEVKVSELLMSETANLSDEKIKAMISALTGAIDGTYTDEASAVKMAIMKAVKEAA